MAELMTTATDPASLSTCPDCESDVTNVHGIYTCSTCSWTPAAHR
jgi:ribosomal protein L37AE/L43A